MRRTEKSVLLFVRLKSYKEGSLIVKGLEIVMDIETLEVYEVIDHDQEIISKSIEKKELSISINEKNHIECYQLNLFEEMNLFNTS